MLELECACDGGKDSLSMAAAAGGETVMAPGNLVVSAYVGCPDVTKVSIVSSGANSSYIRTLSKCWPPSRSSAVSAKIQSALWYFANDMRAAGVSNKSLSKSPV